ncbi:MAG: YebC/PmpR family DNA-binding transcriptional regulator [Patescibacteria group bacterium]
MSGHSKWSSIKHQKGAADAKRGAVFSKLGNAITIAARGGADPETNFQLRIAIDKARAANMPKDNIERSIERGKGGAASGLEEITFEAYGPGGTAFLVEAATDNRNRTASEIRHTLGNHGAKLADSGSVAYLFERKGVMALLANGQAEEIELMAIDAGADDVETDSERVFIYTEPHDLERVRKALAEKGFSIEEYALSWEPKTTIPITDPKIAEQVIKLSHELDNLDDVTKVSSNFDIPENLLG